ncbi:MAG: hypothetical protein K0R24_2190 [Gammaproteobacteria bacterium]|jgi:hypothetical protein|nr:hypothetical protein [Gammaproteobacteria bacterium]
MHTNKLKTTAIIIFFFVIALCSEIKCMDGQLVIKDAEGAINKIRSRDWYWPFNSDIVENITNSKNRDILCFNSFQKTKIYSALLESTGSNFSQNITNIINKIYKLPGGQSIKSIPVDSLSILFENFSQASNNEENFNKYISDDKEIIFYNKYKSGGVALKTSISYNISGKTSKIYCGVFHYNSWDIKIKDLYMDCKTVEFNMMNFQPRSWFS